MANIDTGSEKATKIRYKTQHNPLASQKAGKDMSVARVQLVKTYSLTEIATLIAADGSFMDEADLVYAMTRLSVKMQQLLTVGNAIDVSGLVTLRPVITGPIEKDGSFNAKTNKVLIKATVGHILREIAKDASLEKIGGIVLPVIESVANGVDYLDNILYGQGTNAELKGKRLDFDSSASDEGIFLSCHEYEGDDLTVEVLKQGSDEIKFKVNGEIDTTYTATLTFKTRGGDKNADPVEVKREVILKPAP